MKDNLERGTRGTPFLRSVGLAAMRNHRGHPVDRDVEKRERAVGVEGEAARSRPSTRFRFTRLGQVLDRQTLAPYRPTKGARIVRIVCLRP